MANSLGRVPDCGEFAAQLVSPSIKGGWLWRCNDCGSMFRHPTLPSTEYISLYKKASDAIWGGSETQRNDFAIIYRHLENQAVATILDVGCYTGNFLTGLPRGFTKYGVEPSRAAAQFATSRDIKILGEILDDLTSEMIFDVVVSIDVIEHVLDVEMFLTQALMHVKKGGLLIISTGNPDYFLWRNLFQAKFWYVIYPEHITFPSYKYFCDFAQLHNLSLPEQICFKYMKLTFLHKIFRLLHQICFSFSPSIYRSFKKFFRILTGKTNSISSDPAINAAGIFSDHQIVVFRKDKSMDKGIYAK